MEPKKKKTSTGAPTRKPSSNGSPGRKGQTRTANRGTSRPAARNRSSEEESKAVDAVETASSKPGGRACNDIEWYSKYPDLLLAASQMQFVYKPGMRIPMVTDGRSTVIKDTIPGIMVINWMPAIGQSEDNNSAASIVGKEIYGRVRAAFSGEISVDPPDFVMYFIALDSIFSYITALKRVFRLLNAYTPENFQTPDRLLRSLGLNSELIANLRANQMDFFSVINQLVYMTEKFKCPDIMDYFHRHVWLNDNVFVDAEGRGCQYYTFRQEWFYLMQNVSAQQTTPKLVPTEAPFKTAKTYSALFDFGLQLIAALNDTDDWYTASGYLQRVFGDSGNFVVGALGYSDVAEETYSAEVLSQIENAQSLPFDPVNIVDAMTITQSPATNAVLCSPILNSNDSPVFPLKNATFNQTPYMSWITLLASAPTNLGVDNIVYPHINIHSTSPSPAEVVVASRLATAYTVQPTFSTINTEENTQFYHLSVIPECASELTLSFSLYGTVEGSDLDTGFDIYGGIGFITAPGGLYKITYGDQTDSGNATNTMMAMAKLSQFDWHPLLPIVARSSASASAIRATVIGDVFNFAYMTVEQLAELHRICLYSEFNTFSHT